MIHSWSLQTHRSYQSKLRLIRAFESQHELTILRQARPQAPPTDLSIPLMWCQEAYSLQQGSIRGDDRISFGTIRQLRSAVAQFLTWESLFDTHPGYIDANRRLIHTPIRVTDQLPHQLHALGMSARLGTLTRPATALLDRHVRTLDSALRAALGNSGTVSQRIALCRLGCLNLLLWLGWLRASEAFSLTWADITIVLPAHGAAFDLPPFVGVVLLQLLPETKTSRTLTGDVVLAYETLSGLSVGFWLTTLRRLLVSTDTGRLPTLSLAGSLTSTTFRTAHVLPHLHSLMLHGDAYLQQHHPLPRSFHSLHCYRRGARTHVSRPREVGNWTTRKATLAEVYEHGRWRRRYGHSESIDQHYREWSIYDRLQLTLDCM